MIIYLKEKGAEMRWSTVPFGKYKGKTLPEIIVRDADWFFGIAESLRHARRRGSRAGAQSTCHQNSTTRSAALGSRI